MKNLHKKRIEQDINKIKNECLNIRLAQMLFNFNNHLINESMDLINKIIYNLSNMRKDKHKIIDILKKIVEYEGNNV